MKRNLKLFSYSLLALTILFSSCKKDDDKTPEEQKAEQLSGTWNLTTATPTGFDAITLAGVSITFATDLTYSVSGLSVLDGADLNNGDDFAQSGNFVISGSTTEILTLNPGGAFTTTVNRDTGAITLTYSASYPKSVSDPVSITIVGTLAQ